MGEGCREVNTSTPGHVYQVWAMVAFVPSQALARPFHHGARVFIGVGPVVPWWWAPPVYPAYSPPVVVQQSPPVYIQPQAPAEQYWYSATTRRLLSVRAAVFPRLVESRSDPMKCVALVAVTAVLLTGCASLPSGPSVMVLPGTGKSFEQFQTDDAACRQWAAHGVGGSPGDAATKSTVSGAAIGTAIGAAAGAAVGAAAGSPGVGAAVGAGTGLLFGSAGGASAGYGYASEAQRRYDIAYQQCMYAKGNQVPVVMRRPAARARYVPPPPPPPPASAPSAASPASPAVPPPPPGAPPPPPPGVR